MEADMSQYVYENKTLHLNRHRRKGDSVSKGSDSKEIRKDRRNEKVRDGIMLLDWDRRQNNESNYNGPEKREDKDRRSGKDRRKKP
jgi:hypothetical protein